jgi:hypothetical protein
MKTLFKNIVLAEIDSGSPAFMAKAKQTALFTLIENYIDGVLTDQEFLHDLKVFLGVVK